MGRSDSFNKILMGSLGIMLAIVGYFLTSRDVEVRSGLTRIEGEIGTIKVTTADTNGQLQQMGIEQRRASEQRKDHEDRIRTLEHELKR